MPPLQVSDPAGTNSAKEDSLKVFLFGGFLLHYSPAHFLFFLEHQDEDVFFLLLLGGEHGGRFAGGKEARPAPVCFGSTRSPNYRSRLSGLNGLEEEGGRRRRGERERGHFDRMTSIQYKCSIHCCFCIQPLDSVKCFNICAILNYF